MDIVLSYSLYAAILLFFVFVIYLIELISLRVETSRIESKKELIGLYKKLIKNGYKIQKLKSRNILSELPNIELYLSQNDILIDMFFRLNEVEFLSRREQDRHIDMKAYYDEITSCKNNNVINAVRDTAEIVNFIYKQRHPIQYRVNNFKKNIALRIMFVIVVLRVLGDTIFNKKASNNLKKQYTHEENNIRRSVDMKLSPKIEIPAV